MSRAASLLVLCPFCCFGTLGCDKPKDTTAKSEPEATDGYEIGFEPSKEPPVLLAAADCEIRTEETEAFNSFYRRGRLALKIRKNSELPMCYLYGPDGFPDGLFATVILNKPESPSISIERGIDLYTIIETLPDKSLSLVAMDGDPNGFFESYVVTPSSVTLLGATEYAQKVNELRTLTSAFQFHIRKKSEEK